MASKAKTAKSSASSRSNATKKSVVVSQVSSAKSTLPTKVNKSYVVLGIILVLAAAAIFGLRSYLVAALVNGQPISRLSVIKETEKQAGKQALDNLVRNTLIEQEAKKEKVSVTDKEIDDEIKKAEASVAKQGRKMDEVLATQGLTRTDLRKLIRLDRLVNKMVGKNISITSKEVDDYIDKNKDSLPQDQTPEELRKSVTKQLEQQALTTKVQAWIANLQSKAKVQYFVQY